MFCYLKEIGRGPRGKRDLTYDEALASAHRIFSGDATPAQIGAYLVALRLKPESPDEILAFIHALKERSRHHAVPESLDCAGPYDGRGKSFFATLPAAFIAASCGLPVTLHGIASLPPKKGVSLLDVLREMNIPWDRVKPDLWIEAARKTGVLFIHTEQWCPPLAQVRPYREEVGLRTLFNNAEKLLRLSESSCLAVGVFHRTALKKIAQVLTRLPLRRGLVVQGMEGSEDFPVDRDARALLIDRGNVEEIVFSPREWGIAAEVPSETWTARRQADVAMDVLRGQADSTFIRSAVWNAGIRLWLAEKCDSVGEGVTVAQTALENGAALRSFQQWIDILCGSLHVS